MRGGPCANVSLRQAGAASVERPDPEGTPVATSASRPAFFEECRYEYRHGGRNARSTVVGHMAASPDSADTENHFAAGGLISASVQESCTIGSGQSMPTETTYTSLRANLASLLDRVVDQQETVIVRRRGSRDVALIPASELAGLIETAHLLRPPRNARRLLTALHRAERGKGRPPTAAQLRREILGGTGS